MSVDATRWAWKQFELKASVKLVLLSLADRAGENHECYPSISRLERDTCLDRKTIMHAISTLESMNLLRVERENGSRNCYFLMGVDDRYGDEKTLKPVPKTGPVPKTAPVPKTGRHQYQKRDGTSTKNGIHNLSITYQEPINKQNASKKISELDILTLYCITGQLAEDFIKHRKIKRAAITKTVMDGFKREADKAGISVPEAVTLSIEKNWQGFNADWLRSDGFKPSGSSPGLGGDNSGSHVRKLRRI